MDNESSRSIFVGVNVGVYVIYAMLFFACLYVLLSRRKRNFASQLGCIGALFISVTIALFVALAGDPNASNHKALMAVYETLLLFSHILADFVLAQRCYLLWNKRRNILYAPGVLLLATAMFGLVRVIGYNATDNKSQDLASLMLLLTYLTSLLTNLVLTGLSAGRIWWISRNAEKILGHEVKTKYQAAIAVIVESGVIYSTLLLLIIIMFPIVWKSPSPTASVITSTLVPVTMQVSGIMPTLIIVRAALVKRREAPVTSVSFPSQGLTTSSGNTTRVELNSFASPYDQYKSDLPPLTKDNYPYPEDRKRNPETSQYDRRKHELPLSKDSYPYTEDRKRHPEFGF